jgi:hypothetical protein
MNNTIDLELQGVTGYLISIKRDTKNGWYELEIGIPKNWVYDENDEIKCEILDESATGKLINVAPKNVDILIDDLIAFVEIIIETNEKIAEKENEFKNKMEEMKGLLEKEAKKFYQELDELRENSFATLNDTFIKGLRPEDEKKVKRPYRKSTTSKPVTGTTS